MKISKIRCEYCHDEHDATTKTIELRKISTISMPQLESADNLPSINPPFAIYTYDFCNLKCLLNWLEDLKKNEHPIFINCIN